MDFTMVIPVLIAFVLSVAAGPVVIPVLRRLKMDQTEREDGVKSHLKKAGTPTMDYLKVVLHRSDGLMPMQKMALQIVITAIFAFYIVKVAKIPLTMLIPFSGGKYLNIGWFAIPVLFIAVIGTVNGVNFTDGLDGLASSVTVLVATFFTVVAIGTKSGIEPITCAVVGALLGFLLFNVYPASVFMGDTGSLALGGFVASTAYMLQMPLFIIIVGLIYLVEVLSVMIQVTYFKKTGGKRIFKMAPIHHSVPGCTAGIIGGLQKWIYKERKCWYSVRGSVGLDPADYWKKKGQR